MEQQAFSDNLLVSSVHRNPFMACRFFLDRAREVLKEALGVGVPPDVEAAILAGKGGQWRIGRRRLYVELTRKFICHEMMLSIS
jgi:hypothetical protein